MVGLNPTQVHWYAVLIDAENSKIYSHYSLGTIASNAEKVVGDFQEAGILKDGVSVDKLFFGEVKDISKEWNLCELYPFIGINETGMAMFNRIL
eukprot:7350778-Ditylum_brightwellii.AAC.1